MNRGTYTAANGMIAQQRRLDVLANNLANVNTHGFKADHLTFGDMMVRTMAENGGYGKPIGALSSGPDVNVDPTKTTDFAQGGAENTGNPLDLRLGGNAVAMFAVRDATGATHYTRDGAFRLKDGNALVTASGDAVLDPAGKPIVGLSGPVSSGASGGLVAGGKPVEIGLYVGGFAKNVEGAGLYDGKNVRPAGAGDDVQLESGALETSNVSPVAAMVEMIALQRSYEISQKMIQGQDDSTAKLADTIG